MFEPRDTSSPDPRPPRLVDHSKLQRWSPVSREVRRQTREFVERLTEFPYVTLALVVFLSWAYLLQLVLGWPLTWMLPPSLPADAFVYEILGDRLGWLDAEAVRAGEGWRLISATMLHGSVLHVAGNCAVLYLLGRIVENVYGRSAFLVTYVGAGVAGTSLSVVVSGKTSLGASGAVLGMLGVCLALGLKHRRQIPQPLQDFFRLDMWVFVLLVAVVSALPVVDWAGHLGGFLWGLGLGMVWPPQLLTGKLSPAARGLGGAATGLALAALLYTCLVVGSRVSDVGDYLPTEDLHALQAALDREDLDAARDAALRLAGRFERQPAVQAQIALLLLSLGDHAQGAEMLLAVEAAAPDYALEDPYWDNNLAWALFVAYPEDPVRIEEGMVRIERAVAGDPDNDVMLNSLAYGMHLAGRHEDAERVIAGVMRGKPDDEVQNDVYIQVLALAALGRGEEALLTFRKFSPLLSAEENPATVDARLLRARARDDLASRGLLVEPEAPGEP